MNQWTNCIDVYRMLIYTGNLHNKFIFLQSHAFSCGQQDENLNSKKFLR